VGAYRAFGGAWLAMGREGGVISRTAQWYAGYCSLVYHCAVRNFSDLLLIYVDYLMAQCPLRVLLPVDMRRGQFWLN
jgi:hypothetical protein